MCLFLMVFNRKIKIFLIVFFIFDLIFLGYFINVFVCFKEFWFIWINFNVVLSEMRSWRWLNDLLFFGLGVDGWEFFSELVVDFVWILFELFVWLGFRVFLMFFIFFVIFIFFLILLFVIFFVVFLFIFVILNIIFLLFFIFLMIFFLLVYFCGLSIVRLFIVWVLLLMIVLILKVIVWGMMVIGRSKVFLNEVRILCLIWLGLVEVRKVGMCDLESCVELFVFS